jgi:UDP-N-acetylmuramoylalanine--D-glutamate ligase
LEFGILKLMDVKGKRFTIIGAARSGIAVAKLLKSFGAEVFVSDSANEDSKKEEIENLRNLNIPYEFGEHTLRCLQADSMVVSPGVPMTLFIIDKAYKQNIPVYSELEVAGWFCKAPIIAITGSNGKTTTTTLLGEIFRFDGRNSIVAGNIGTAFSDLVLNAKENGVAVIEVSSFQLEGIYTFKPKVSAILNISKNHLDRYKTYGDYIAAKLRIFENQNDNDYLVYNADDEGLSNLVTQAKAYKIPFSIKRVLKEGAWIENGKVVLKVRAFPKTEIIDINSIGIKGEHNLYNSLSASVMAKLFDVENENIEKGLREFKGVEHRLEFVREINGVKFINDSKATTVNSVWYALRSFNSPIVLIAGGQYKDEDYSEFLKLEELIKEKVKILVLVGKATEGISKTIGHLVKTIKADTFEKAVKTAYSQAKTGDIVLLSPACASFDMFKNYEDRGNQFKNIVNNL